MNDARQTILKMLISNNQCKKEASMKLTEQELTNEDSEKKIDLDKTMIYNLPPDGCQTTLQYLSSVLKS